MSVESTAQPSEWTITRLLAWTGTFLGSRQVDEPRLAAEVLLAHALRCRRIDLYARFDQVPSEEQLAMFRDLVRRASEAEPIAYLVGEKEFFSKTFTVSPAVLIPRPETETLIESVVEHLGDHGTPATFLDVGTGSGCIAITLLTQLPEARAVGSDISAAALEVATANAKRHGVVDRLTLVEADRLALPGDAVPDGGFDFLLSNPPYIAARDMSNLASTVRDYEPRAALTDDEDGLSFYRSLAADGPDLLAPGGRVVVEVADDCAGAATAALTATSRLAHERTWKDRVTGRDRVVVLTLQ